jgi:CheY-like chemotaxis protein
VALLLALVGAVLVVLGVFAWVLLAPLIRSRTDDEDSEGADAAVWATALFSRPVRRAPGTVRPRPAAIPPAAAPAAPVPPRASVPPAATPPPAAAAPDPGATRTEAEPVPALEVEAAAAPRRRAFVVPATPQPPVADVLVVTADAGLSTSQCAILAASGCASRCAASASDAVGELRIRIPDLLLVDAAGPSEAVTLLAALRHWQATETLPVVVYTAAVDEVVRRQAAELGATDVVAGAQSVPGLVERALPYWLAGVGVFNGTIV